MVCEACGNFKRSPTSHRALKAQRFVAFEVRIESPACFGFVYLWQILAITFRSGRYDSSEMKLAAVFALIVLGVRAQTIEARLDALVAPYRESDAPGMVAMLIHVGRIVWQTAFGLADVETHRAITPDTQFELASVTKQFTAMAIVILSEQGKIKFGDTLDKYCPEFPAYARSIRIRDLLHHISGLPDYEKLMVGTIGDNFFLSSKGPPAQHEFTSAEVLKT